MNKNQLNEEILEREVKNIPKGGLYEFEFGKTPVIIGQLENMTEYENDVFYMKFSLKKVAYAYIIGKRLKK